MFSEIVVRFILFLNHLYIFFVFDVTSFKTDIFLKSKLLGYINMFGASQVVQWLRIGLPMEETQVLSLGGEEPLE